MNCFLTLWIGWPRVRDRQPYGGVSSAHGWRVRVAITAEVAGLHTPKQSVLFLSSQKHWLVDSLATCYTKPKVFCWVRYSVAEAYTTSHISSCVCRRVFCRNLEKLSSHTTVATLSASCKEQHTKPSPVHLCLPLAPADC